MENEIEITHSCCTGCHSCYSICPQRAIEMKCDYKGFLRPIINRNLCVGCGLCQKACPLNCVTVPLDEKTVAYAAFSLDSSVHYNSSSGGIFTLLSTEVINYNNGAVYGAAFNDSYNVIHTRSTTDVRIFQTSKYVQSRIGDSFLKVEDDLRNNMTVLFSGTPCQTAGLKKYLDVKGVDTRKLMLVDIICHGVPSPLLWEKHVKNVSGERIPVFISFRDKRNSWGGYNFTCRFSDGTEYSVVANMDSYMKGFSSNMILRDSCYSCQYKTISRVADITLADYWGVENHDPDMKTRNGTSAVIIHSANGLELFSSVSSKMKKKEIELTSVIDGNSAMVKSVCPHPRTQMFWTLGNEQNYDHFEDIIDTLMKPTIGERFNRNIVSLKRKIKRTIKPICNIKRSN